MKILHLSTEDTRPGAARAAYRLNKGLNKIGIESTMLVQNKRSDDKTVQGLYKGGPGRITVDSRKLLDKARLLHYSERENTPFSPQWVANKKLFSKVASIEPDIINIHWICDGFVQIESLAKFKRPLVWTLRDMWPFTGGCHYDQECNRYTEACGACPQLGSNRKADLSRLILKRKMKAWQSVDLTVVALSSWIGECAARSSVFKNNRIEVISNGLDTDLYRPIDTTVARKILNLPVDKKLIVFGAVQATSAKRKGFHLLQAALSSLSESTWKDKLELVIFGASEPSQDESFGFNAHYLGHLNDEMSLSLAYSAADVLVAPSIQENLPNTVLEALACGTPSIAFNIGGMPDLIVHQENGYLVKPFDIRDLAQGIVWTIENEERYQKLSHNARHKIEREFTLKSQARKYFDLYEDICKRQK